MHKLLKFLGIYAAMYVFKRVLFSVSTVNAGDQILSADVNTHINQTNTNTGNISSHASTLSTHTSQISTANSNIAQNLGYINLTNGNVATAQNDINNLQAGRIPGVYSAAGNIQFYTSLTNYSGQFIGNGFYIGGGCSVGGGLSKGSGTFKIDHPLDPENKYLYHSFVESPDMKNIYDGVVTCDAQGEATIELPDWFDALNNSFRYQLTTLGAYAPVYIKEELTDIATHFVIGGALPDMRVSWQVTGIRKDAYALANPVLVEEEKAEEDKGLYLYPELFGLPREESIYHTYGAREEKKNRGE